MAGIAVLLAAAAVSHALARIARIPPIPVLLASGVVIGQIGLIDPEQVRDVFVLGVAILLFVTGIELNPRRTRTQREAALRVGIVQFFVMGGIGFLAARILGIDALGALYVALALTASSTLIGIRLLQQRRHLFEPFGRLVVGVLLLQDLLVILLVPVVTRIADGAGAVLIGLLSIAGLGLLALAVMRRVAPFLASLDGEDESMLLGIMAVLFLFIALAAMLELPLVVGAFLAGVALSRFPTSGVVRGQLDSIGDFFSAIFFPALGARLTALSVVEFGQATVLALVVVVVTPAIVAWIAERAGFSARSSLEAGLLLAQTSELSLVIGLHALIEGDISSNTFTIIALVTAITMVTTPFLTGERVVWRLLRWHPGRKDDPPPLLTDHVVLLGTGTTGMPLLETILAAGRDVIVVDDDPAVIARLRDAEVLAIRGDALDAEVLERAHAAQARVISSTVRRSADNRRLLEFAQGVPVLVRVFEEEETEWIRAIGGTPVVYSRAAAEGLMRWYDREKDALERTLRQRIKESDMGPPGLEPGTKGL
ncbi:MAG: cation:proton antiporter [Longimicrobiales bacterium]